MKLRETEPKVEDADSLAKVKKLPAEKRKAYAKNFVEELKATNELHAELKRVASRIATK